MKRILFVDDEAQILKSLERLFIAYDNDYEVLTAESGAEALAILEKQEADLVVSDMRMPGMDGYELLRRIKLLYPEVLRVILSGYSEEQMIVKALQQGVAKMYMLKPWENDQLVKMIEQLLKTEDLLKSKDLLRIINNIDELPTIKSSYQKIIAMIEEDRDISEIAKEIEKDQSITTRVLHVANSAFYSVKTGSVQHAVAYLGLCNVRNLIFSASIFDAFDAMKVNIDYISKLWNHSFLTNKILAFIYEECKGVKMNELSSTAGLLHNIGIVFILNFFAKNYKTIRDKAQNEQIDLLELELIEYGITHQEAGGYLLQWWDLPFPIVEAALYHHNPLDDRIINRTLVAAVHIAQKYAWEILNDQILTAFYEEAFAIAGISKEEFENKLICVEAV